MLGGPPLGRVDRPSAGCRFSQSSQVVSADVGEVSGPQSLRAPSPPASPRLERSPVSFRASMGSVSRRQHRGVGALAFTDQFGASAWQAPLGNAATLGVPPAAKRNEVVYYSDMK